MDDKQSADNSHIDTLPKPQPGVYTSKPNNIKKPAHRNWKPAGLVALCLAAGFLGSWVFMSSGIIKLQGGTTISSSRQSVIAEGEVITEVAKTVSPSVVSITTKSVTSTGLFGPTALEGAGTGIIISADGYILTNKHVIPDGVSAVSVVLQDGKTYEEVTVVGRDPLNDIAFLKINNVTDLTAAKLGDSSTMEVGQKVVAIGNALGQFQTTVTSGIISGTSRPVTASDGTTTGVEQLENLFQTDAAINPGNSGGPLVNHNGEVIGINTAVAEGAQGIGFAIPINDAKGLIKGVVTSGQIQRAYLGVRYVTISPETAKRLNLSQQKGAYIGGSDASPIISGGPAEKAGIKADDIITKVNGVELNDRVTLIGQLSQFVPGDEVTLTILRDKKEQAIKVTLEKLES